SVVMRVLSMKGVFFDNQTLKPEELDMSGLETLGIDWTQYPTMSTEQVAERLAGAVVASTNKVVIDRATIEANPSLKLICICATGTNNVDLAAASRRGVIVCNVNGYGTASVAQHTLALILGLATRWNRYDQDARSGVWSRSPMFCLMDYPV